MLFHMSLLRCEEPGNNAQHAVMGLPELLMPMAIRPRRVGKSPQALPFLNQTAVYERAEQFFDCPSQRNKQGPLSIELHDFLPDELECIRPQVRRRHERRLMPGIVPALYKHRIP